MCVHVCFSVQSVLSLNVFVFYSKMMCSTIQSCPDSSPSDQDERPVDVQNMWLVKQVAMGSSSTELEVDIMQALDMEPGSI